MAGTIFSAVAAPLIGGAVQSLFGGGSSGNKGASSAAAAADPTAGQRPQYQEQLARLMSDPGSFSMTPGAKFAEQNGRNAESAAMASRGLSGSGAEKIALTKYATGFAGQQYQQQISDLMTLSGATSGSPAAAGQILANQSGSNTSALSTFGNTVGQAVTGSQTFQNWMGGGGPSNAVTNATIASAPASTTDAAEFALLDF